MTDQSNEDKDMEPQGSPAPGETASPQPRPNGALVAQPASPPPREIRVVTDTIGLFDTGKFEHLQRIAMVMAISDTVPITLRFGQQPVQWDDKGKISKWAETELPRETVQARCMMVANQAQRWKMDPFALLPCASFIRNRLSYEGKVVMAAIESMLGIRLTYTYAGQGENIQITVSGQFRDEATPRTVKGTVAQWRTKGDSSPWSKPADWERQLVYRGAPEWARRHAPGVILGVILDSETLDHDELAEHSAPIVPRKLVAPAPPPVVTAVTVEAKPEPVKGNGQRRAPAPPPMDEEDGRALADVVDAGSDGEKSWKSEILAEIEACKTEVAVVTVQNKNLHKLIKLSSDDREDVISKIEEKRQQLRKP